MGLVFELPNGRMPYRLARGLLILILLFQLSMIKYVFGISILSTAVNLLMLILFSALAAISVGRRVFPMSVWGGYIIPGLLVYLGFLLNITLNLISDFGVVGYFGLLLPWAAYLSIPFLIRDAGDSQNIWRFFYRFMYVFSVIGVFEYFLVFGNILSPRTFDTPMGQFSTVGLSVLYTPLGGIPNYRMHGIFPEPGTLAMYLLPAFMYALAYKKYIALMVFSVSILLTNSLGGYISLAMLVMIYVFVKARNARFSFGITMIPVVILGAALAIYVVPIFSDIYASKGESAEVRESNFENVVGKIPLLIVNYPLGMKLAGQSMSDISGDEYYGSNFAPGVAHVIGGDLALLGYCMLLISCLIIPITSLRKRVISFDQLVVFPTLLALLPFVFQRATIMDSAAFAFMFSPSLIRHLQSLRK